MYFTKRDDYSQHSKHYQDSEAEQHSGVNVLHSYFGDGDGSGTEQAICSLSILQLDRAASGTPAPVNNIVR